VIETLSCQCNRFIDKTISPSKTKYYYCVMSAFEGTVGRHKTLIESKQSDVRSIECIDRFDLKVLGGDTEKVNLRVTVKVNGVLRSHVFTAKVGERIGGVENFSGLGAVDFSTNLMLISIRTRETEEEILVHRPIFNPDGSRSLDQNTGEPLFNDRMENQKLIKLSIKCRNPSGEVRIVEEI